MDTTLFLKNLPLLSLQILLILEPRRGPIHALFTMSLDINSISWLLFFKVYRLKKERKNELAFNLLNNTANFRTLLVILTWNDLVYSGAFHPKPYTLHPSQLDILGWIQLSCQKAMYIMLLKLCIEQLSVNCTFRVRASSYVDGYSMKQLFKNHHWLHDRNVAVAPSIPSFTPTL